MNIVMKVNCPKCSKRKAHKVKIQTIGSSVWISGSTCFKCGFRFNSSGPDKQPIRIKWEFPK
jgi:C4-type Zn-finger protein